MSRPVRKERLHARTHADRQTRREKKRKTDGRTRADQTRPESCLCPSSSDWSITLVERSCQPREKVSRVGGDSCPDLAESCAQNLVWSAATDPRSFTPSGLLLLLLLLRPSPALRTTVDMHTHTLYSLTHTHNKSQEPWELQTSERTSSRRRRAARLRSFPTFRDGPFEIKKVK